MGNVVYLYDELHEQARSRSTSPTTSMGAKGSRWAAAPQLCLPDPPTSSTTNTQTLPLASSLLPTPNQQPPKVDAPNPVQTFDAHERNASSESATFIYTETDRSSDELSQETSPSSPHSARSGTEVLSPTKNLESCQNPDTGQTRLVAAAAPDVQPIEEDPWAAWDPNSGAGLQGSDAFARRQALTAIVHAEQAIPAHSSPSSPPPRKAAAASKWKATASSSSVPQLQASEPSLLSRIAKLAPQDEIKSTRPTSPPTSGLGNIPPNPAASVGEEDGWSAWTAHPQAAKGGADAHKKRQAMTASRQLDATAVPVAPKLQKAATPAISPPAPKAAKAKAKAAVASPPPVPQPTLAPSKQQSKAKAPKGPATAPKTTVKPPPVPCKSWREYHATMSQALSMVRAKSGATALASNSTQTPPTPPPVPYKFWEEYNATMSEALKTIQAAREAAALALKVEPTPLTPPRQAKTLSTFSSPKKLPVSRAASDISTYTRNSEVLGPSGFPEGSLLDQIAMGGSPRQPPSTSKATSSTASLVAMKTSQVPEKSQASLIDIASFDVRAPNSEAMLLDSNLATSGVLLELDGLCLGSPVPLADPTSPLSCFEDHDTSMSRMPTAGDILVPSPRNGKESNFSLSQASHESGHSSPSLLFDRSVSSSQCSAERLEQQRSSSRSSSRLTKLSSLSAAVETLGLDKGQEHAVLKLLQALPKKDRATCVFNKDFLKAKVEEALYIVSIDAESTDSEEEL